MLNALKQFVAKATGSPDKFQTARLRLTGIYALLLLAVFIISSVITHSIFSSRLDHRFIVREHTPFPPPQAARIGRDTRDQVRQELLISMALVNGMLFIGAVGASYVLAGITLRPIRQVYERQRLFLSDASHELRTPLAILQTDLENELDNSKSSVREKTNASGHLEEVKRMSNLVNDLLLISRLDGADRLSPPKENVDLQEIVTTAVQRLQSYAAKRQVKIIPSPSTPTKPTTITANKEALIQAISNLIKNGIDYNKVDGKVVVNLQRAKDSATIIISDTGIGIDEKEIPKLFDRFYRVDQSRTRQIGGSGLGLSIVQSVIYNSGGSVKISSKKDHGTKVTLIFPQKKLS